MIPEKYLEFDAPFINDVFTDPQEIDIDIRGALAYCERRQKSADEMSEAELQRFIKPRDNE